MNVMLTGVEQGGTNDVLYFDAGHENDIGLAISTVWGVAFSWAEIVSLSFRHLSG